MLISHIAITGIIRSYTRSGRSIGMHSGKLKAIRPSIKPWQSSCYPDRMMSIILTRLRIGHTHLTHRYMMPSREERQTPQFNSCQAHLTVEHISVDCIHFNSERRLNYFNGRSIQEILDVTNVESIVNFLKQINLYCDI